MITGNKCLKKISGALSKGYKEVELELAQTIVPESGDTGVDLKPLYFTYREPGEKKRRRSYVDFNYCPFCGVKGNHA